MFDCCDAMKDARRDYKVGYCTQETWDEAAHVPWIYQYWVRGYYRIAERTSANWDLMLPNIPMPHCPWCGTELPARED